MWLIRDGKEVLLQSLYSSYHAFYVQESKKTRRKKYINTFKRFSLELLVDLWFELLFCFLILFVKVSFSNTEKLMFTIEYLKAQAKVKNV
jgi:hypothetical protein